MNHEHISYPLIRPIPQDQESPCSLLLRYSEFNGWKSPDKFLREHGLLKTSQKMHSLFIDKNKWSLVVMV